MSIPETTLAGYWIIDVPVSPSEVEEDMALLNAWAPPAGVVIWSAEVVVHGRRWEWRKYDMVFGNWGGRRV